MMTLTLRDEPKPAMAATGAVLWLLMLSAALAETDVYRYAGLLLAGYGLLVHRSMQPRMRPSAAAILCTLWSLYVLVRFLSVYALTPNHQHGSSEWLYAFPLFFPPLGMALARLRRHAADVITAFFAVAAVALAATQHWPTIATGLSVTPLFHNNQIHGAAACGLIMIGAFFWFLHHAQEGTLRTRNGRAAMALAPVVVVLSTISLFGSQSKGAWLALAGALPVAGLIMLVSQRRTLAARAFLALVAIVMLFVWIMHGYLWARLGAPVEALVSMARDYGSSGDFIAYLRARIDSGQIPSTIGVRLQIWYNALQLFRSAPVFGHGNMWIELWEKTRYAKVGFTLMHNGYLEILIRHGLFGLAVCGAILVCMLAMMQRGFRAGVISLAALQAYWVLLVFFMLTLLSNSNNRLAIGESFAMLMGAVAFYAEIMTRYARQHRVDGAPAGEAP